jgi:hypothetical protein
MGASGLDSQAWDSPDSRLVDDGELISTRVFRRGGPRRTGTEAPGPMAESRAFPPFRDKAAEGWGTRIGGKVKIRKNLGCATRRVRPKPDCEGLCYPRCPKARHLGHPVSVVVLASPGTWATRHPGHPVSVVLRTSPGTWATRRPELCLIEASEMRPTRPVARLVKKKGYCHSISI